MLKYIVVGLLFMICIIGSVSGYNITDEPDAEHINWTYLNNTFGDNKKCIDRNRPNGKTCIIGYNILEKNKTYRLGEWIVFDFFTNKPFDVRNPDYPVQLHLSKTDIWGHHISGHTTFTNTSMISRNVLRVGYQIKKWDDSNNITFCCMSTDFVEMGDWSEHIWFKFPRYNLAEKYNISIKTIDYFNNTPEINLSYNKDITKSYYEIYVKILNKSFLEHSVFNYSINGVFVRSGSVYGYSLAFDENYDLLSVGNNTLRVDMFDRYGNNASASIVVFKEGPIIPPTPPNDNGSGSSSSGGSSGSSSGGSSGGGSGGSGGGGYKPKPVINETIIPEIKNITTINKTIAEPLNLTPENNTEQEFEKVRRDLENRIEKNRAEIRNT